MLPGRFGRGRRSRAARRARGTWPHLRRLVKSPGRGRGQRSPSQGERTPAKHTGPRCRRNQGGLPAGRAPARRPSQTPPRKCPPPQRAHGSCSPRDGGKEGTWGPVPKLGVQPSSHRAISAGGGTTPTRGRCTSPAASMGTGAGAEPEVRRGRRWGVLTGPNALSAEVSGRNPRPPSGGASLTPSPRLRVRPV